MHLSGGIVGAGERTRVGGRKGPRRRFWAAAHQDPGRGRRTRSRWRCTWIVTLAVWVVAIVLYTASWQGEVTVGAAPLPELDRGGNGSDSRSEVAAGTAQAVTHLSEVGRADDFAAWYRLDAKHLADLARRVSAHDRQSVAEVKREAAFIRGRIAWLEANPSYSDPDSGFSVYDPRATGWLHVLSIAARAREELLATRSDRAVPGPEEFYHLKDGTPLYDAAEDNLPKVADVVDTLRAIDLPRAAFAGYRVYLLPLSMGDTGGLGASGYTLVGAPAAGRDVISNQVQVTVAHEFGHHVQLMSLGASYQDNPRAWRRYMDVRGIPRWTPDGEVSSVAWAASPEETFAEDVRVLFGPDPAASEPHATAYGDPRADQVLAGELRRLIRAYAGSLRERSDPAGRSPWTPEPQAGWLAWAQIMPGMRGDIDAAALPVVALVLLGTGIVTRLGLRAKAKAGTTASGRPCAGP